MLVQVDESSRQREEINSLLAQVCDLQSRVQRFSHENDDLTANLRVYQVSRLGLNSGQVGSPLIRSCGFPRMESFCLDPDWLLWDRGGVPVRFGSGFNTVLII